MQLNKISLRIHDSRSRDESTVWVPRGAPMVLSKVIDVSIPWTGHAVLLLLKAEWKGSRQVGLGLFHLRWGYTWLCSLDLSISD